MSGLPPRPHEPGSPFRSPERDRDDRRRDLPPHDSRGYSPDRHYDGRRDYDDRWADDYDRKRRRSPSPSYSHQRPRLRSPSPNRWPDPASLEYLLNFKQFAEWFRHSHPKTAREDDEDLRQIRLGVETGALPESILIEKHGMAKRYERYRKEYTSRQLYTIYLTHRDEAWFKERYSPSEEARALRRRVNRQGRVPTVLQYINELRDGKWDDVDFDQKEDQKPPTEEPEGLDRALGDEAYDPLRIEVPPRPGQVFVKTVPPSTRRVDLEGVFAKHPGFQWLALSDPSAKRGFHRVGWAQYEEGVNVEDAVNTIDSSKIDNFTFHMGVNATPIVGRIRVAPSLTGNLRRLEQDLSYARELARTLEDELMEETSPAPEDGDGDKPDGEASADSAPKDTTPGLRERGSEVVEDVIARLLASSGLDGEDLDEEQAIRKAKISLDQYINYLRHGLSTCYYCVVPTSFPEELHRKCVGHIRARPDAGEGENGHDRDRERERERERDRDERDRSEAKNDDEPADAQDNNENEEREKREGPTSKRYTFPTKSNDERWIETLDLKVRSLIEDVNVADYGGRDLDEETKRLTAPHIKQEETDKYRCKQCTKLFRAPEFVIKHMSSKHPEIMKDKLEDLAVFNAFCLDPQHLQPSSTTPAAIDDQLPLAPGTLPAFNPAKAAQAMFNQSGSQSGGFNMAMQQQMMMMMQMQMMMQGGGQGSSSSMPGGPSFGAIQPPSGAKASRDFDPASLPPAPPGGEDPRARRGRVSYHDLDEPGSGGDAGLPY